MITAAVGGVSAAGRQTLNASPSWRPVRAGRIGSITRERLIVSATLSFSPMGPHAPRRAGIAG
jgi:hypothetical protein